jgi:hypothetical protein
MSLAAFVRVPLGWPRRAKFLAALQLGQFDFS